LEIPARDDPRALTLCSVPHRRGILLVGLLWATVAAASDKPVLLHTARAQAPAGEALEVEGSLVGSQRLSRVVIRYRGPGEDFSETPMELQYGDLYRGHIPAQRLSPPGVEYYVEGTLRTGEKVTLFATPAKPTRVFVVGQPSPPQPPEEPRVQGKGRKEPKEPPKEARAPREPKEPEVVEARPFVPDEPVFTERPPRAEPPLLRSELEEELALYSAVDTVALATRQDERVQKVPAIAASYGRRQIRALGARSVHDVLDVIPGLTISRDVQGFHRTAVRGLRSDPEVLFLINGHPINNLYDGRALANLPIENVERIEVIRGPGSALFGTGAFLGVVNVVTVGEETGVSGAVSGGSFETFSGHVGGHQKLGDAQVYADADVLRQEGYQRPVVQDSLDAETRRQGLRTSLKPSGVTRDQRMLVNLGAGAKYDHASAGQLALSVRYMNEGRTALIGLFDTVGPDSQLGWSVLLLDAGWRKSLSDRVSLHARGSFDHQSVDRLFQLTPRDFAVDGVPQPTGLLERTRAGTRGLGFEAGADFQLLPQNRLSVGAVVQHAALTRYAYETNHLLDESGNITEFLGTELRRPNEAFAYPQELAGGAAASRLILGLYAHDQWTIVEPLTVTLGFRLDATQLPTVDLERNITGSAFVPSFNPRAGLVWSVSDPLVLKLLYGRAFRSPTVQELAEAVPSTDFNQGRFQGNAGLDPATVDTVELGADLIQSAGESRVRLRGNLFYQAFGNPIAAVDDSGNVFPLRNRTGGVRVFGAEGEARLEASDRANTWVNASWFRARDLEADLPLLTDVPQLRLNAGMSMPIGGWLNFDLLVKIGVERRNNSRTELEYLRRYRLPPYALVGAQLRSERLFDHVEVTLTGQNLLNLDYADDVPRPDRVPGFVPREGLSGFVTVRGNL
jgi:outer membrane receptor protein involved in Fe transport